MLQRTSCIPSHLVRTPPVTRTRPHLTDTTRAGVTLLKHGWIQGAGDVMGGGWMQRAAAAADPVVDERGRQPKEGRDSAVTEGVAALEAAAAVEGSNGRLGEGEGLSTYATCMPDAVDAAELVGPEGVMV